jgi:hypothetical protein
VEAAAILKIIAFAIAEGPEVYNLTTRIIADIKRKFNTPDERVQALDAMLLLLAPMEKEV